MNVYGENLSDLQKAIDSYLCQDVQLIISTVEKDACIDFVNTNYSGRIDLFVMPLSQHPGRCPMGSFVQLNAALHLIKTDWFCFASSNDTALFNKIKTEIDCCTKSGKKICYSSFFITDENLNQTGIRTFREYDFKRHLVGNFVSDCSIIHRSIFEKYFPFKTEFNNYAFWDLWLRIYEGEGDVFIYNQTPTWNYRQSANSMHIKRQSNPEQVEQYKQDFERMINTHIQ